ncbi:hypothetical protein VTN49DRAFT_7693 [Thermomyces lanuginosus]|uniref:uncharacterized protein n=1 Tax=Thermomyces lanuginosus TaxID=5541 RepID=UPI0037432EC4
MCVRDRNEHDFISSRRYRPLPGGRRRGGPTCERRCVSRKDRWTREPMRERLVLVVLISQLDRLISSRSTPANAGRLYKPDAAFPSQIPAAAPV